MKKLLFFSLLSLFSFFSYSQDEDVDFKIYPIDESKQDIDLYAFVDELKDILVHKDTARLFQILDYEVVSSFGGGMLGKEDFILNWQLDNPNSSDLWNKMLHIISLGGAFEIGGVAYDRMDSIAFYFPYIVADKCISPLFEIIHKLKLKVDLDPYTTIYCINQDIPLYKGPDENSEIIAHLSYDVLLLDYKESYTYNQKNNSEEWEWFYVSTLDHSISGWIVDKQENIYLGSDYSLCIEKIEGKYVITGFYPYD